jgi:hypothetical protein
MVQALESISGTAAGERVLIAAVRARVLQQQPQVVAAYRARGAQLAALLRSLAYAGRGAGGGAGPAGGGGIPWSAACLGLNGMPGPHRTPRTALTSRTDHRRDRVSPSSTAAIDLSQVGYVKAGAAGGRAGGGPACDRRRVRCASAAWGRVAARRGGMRQLQRRDVRTADRRAASGVLHGAAAERSSVRQRRPLTRCYAAS